MKKMISVLSALLIAQLLPAQYFNCDWTSNYSTSCSSRGGCVTMLSGEDVVAAGIYNGTSDFDPTGGVATLSLSASPGQSEMYIQKVNYTNTAFAWRIAIIGTGEEIPTNMIAVQGNIYVIGSFTKTAKFNPLSMATVTSVANSSDIFIARYDGGGNFLSMITIGSSGFDAGFGIWLESTGNILVSGQFSGTVNFNPSGTFNLVSSGGSIDGFFARYSPTLGFMNAWRIGGTGEDNVTGVTSDALGEISICGSFEATCDFNPLETHAGTAYKTAIGMSDGFVSHYTSAGVYTWVRTIGTADIDEAMSLCTDASNNIYLTGAFGTLGTVGTGTTNDLDPSAIVHTLYNAGTTGSSDVFILKYRNNGNYYWSRSMGDIEDDAGINIHSYPEGAGHVVITGYFSGTVDFDYAAPTAYLNGIAPGDTDMFILRYTYTGNYNHVDGVIAAGEDGPWDSYLDGATDRIFITGDIQSPVNMEPDPGAPADPGWAPLLVAGSFLASYSWASVPPRLAAPGTEETGNLHPYPNPTEGKIMLYDITNGTVAEIYTLDGRLCQRSEATQDGSWELELGDLENGMYVLRVTRADGIVDTEKIVLRR